MNKYFWITLTAIVAIVSLYIVLTGQEPSLQIGLRNTSGTQYIHNVQEQNVVSVAYDGSTDEIFLAEGNTATAHGLVVGDVVRFHTASAGFGGDDAPGFSSDTNYFVITATTSTTFEVSTTEGGTAVDIAAAASAGGAEFMFEEKGGTAQRVGDYSFLTLGVDVEATPSVSLKFLCSIQENEPNWYGAQANDNQYEYCDVYDIEDDTEVDGDTGLAVNAGTAAHRTFWIADRVVNWITAITENFASGSVTVRLLGGE